VQVWVGVPVAVAAAVVAVLAGPRAARWASGIEVRFPAIVVAATAAVGGFVVGATLGLTPALAAFGVLSVGAAVLVGIDLRLHRLPDRLTSSLAASGLALLAVAASIDGAWPAYGRALLGGFTLLATYLLLFLAARSGLGAGDVKLAGVLGLHLGWLGWPALVVGALAGVLAGGLLGLALLAAGRATMATRVPFGPSMVAGALLALALGNDAAAALLGG